MQPCAFRYFDLYGRQDKMNRKKGMTKPPDDLTEGALLGKIIKFSLPLMASGLLQTLYNAADMIVVGRFSGSNSMGAVGACGSLINLIIGLFLGITVGTGVLVAQYIGAKKDGEVDDAVHTSLITATVGGTVLAIIGFILAEPMLRLMGTPNEIIGEAIPYLKAYFVGVPASMIYNFMSTALRSEGNTKAAFFILGISGVSNVLFNLLFVIVLGMNALGVGIATAISMYISAILILIYMFKANIRCRLSLRKLRFNYRKFKSIIKIGIPSGIQSSLFSLSHVLIQSTINGYGEIMVAGNAASSNIDSFVYVAMNAFHHAALTFVGQNVGAGKHERVKKTIMLCTVTVTVVGFVLGCSAYLFGDTLLSIYEPHSEAVRQAGLMRMSVVSVTYFLCGIMEVASGALKAFGYSMRSMIISLIGSCIFRLVWIPTVCPLPIFEGNITVLFISYPISWILTTVALFIAVYFAYKKHKNQLPALKREELKLQQ